MADVFFKDEDVIIKDEDVLFDEHYFEANDSHIVQAVDTVALNLALSVSDCAVIQFDHWFYLDETTQEVFAQNHVLAVSDGMQGNVTDSLALTALNVLAISDGIQANVADTLDIGGTLQPASCTQLNYADTVTLSQELTLTVSDTTHVQSAGVPTITTDEASTADAVWSDSTDTTYKDTTDTVWYPHELSSLTVSDCVQANVADTLALTAEALLVLQSPYNAQVADSVILSQEHNGLAPQDCANINVADVLGLIQEQRAVGQDTYHVQTVDAPAFEQEHVLSLSDGAQIQSVDELSLTVEGGEEFALAVADGTQINVSDGAAVFVQEYVLTVSDSVQVNVADTATVLTEGMLAVEASTQAQTADGVTLQQEQVIDVDDVYNSNVADTLGAFAQIQILIADDSADEQYAETPTLSELSADSVAVENASQNNVADTLVLIQEYVLANSDCAQINVAGTLDLVAFQLLGIANCTQSQYADAVSIITDTGIGVVINPYLYSITVARNMQSVTPNRYLVN